MKEYKVYATYFDKCDIEIKVKNEVRTVYDLSKEQVTVIIEALELVGFVDKSEKEK